MSDNGAEENEMGHRHRMSEKQIDRVFAGLSMTDGEGLAEVSELLAKLRDEYIEPPPEPLEREHVAALVAESRRISAAGNGAATNGAAAVSAAAAASIAPRRAGKPVRSVRWRLGLLYGALVLLLVPASVAGLAVAGVKLPGLLTAPFGAVGIDLPNQDGEDDTLPSIGLPALDESGTTNRSTDARRRSGSGAVRGQSAKGGERRSANPPGPQAPGSGAPSSGDGAASNPASPNPAGAASPAPGSPLGGPQGTDVPRGSAPGAGKPPAGPNPGAAPPAPSTPPESGNSGSGPPASPPGSSGENPFGGPPGLTDQGAPGQTGAAPPDRGGGGGGGGS